MNFICCTPCFFLLRASFHGSVFEQYTAIKLMRQDSSFTVQMVLPPDQMNSFNQTLSEGESGQQKVITEFSNIDVENAQASVPKDEETVKTLIQKTVGFSKVSEAVQDNLVQWCTQAFGQHMKSKVSGAKSP